MTTGSTTITSSIPIHNVYNNNKRIKMLYVRRVDAYHITARCTTRSAKANQHFYIINVSASLPHDLYNELLPLYYMYIHTQIYIPHKSIYIHTYK